MTSEKQRQKERNYSAMVENLITPDQPEPEVVEELLWAYALDALELPEREHVLQLVAQSSRAQETLERIEQSVATAARMQEVPVAANIRRRLLHTLAEMGRDLSTVAAVVVAKGGRLVVAFGEAVSSPDATTLGLAPATLGGKAKTEAETPLRLVGPEGMTLIVTPRDEGLFEIDVTIEPAVEGKAALFKLEIKDGREAAKQIGIRRTLQDGRASLPGCPTGVIKITGPDSREMIIYLESDRQ